MKFIFSLALCLSVNSLFSQEANKAKEMFVGCIGFWNVENLYDTIDGPNDDAEFLPKGGNQWTGARYKAKIEHLSEVISQMGSEITPDGPAILGLCEIENKGVLEDLVKAEKIKKRDYQIVHYDSPDLRGVDVALLYQPKYFKLKSSKKYKVILPNNPTHPTRDILLVSGLFDGELMHFFVNHWPSRSGGEAKSKPGRGEAARICRLAIDSILKTDANAKILLMGDLNDDPINESVKLVLKANGKKTKLQSQELYNTSYDNFKSGIGTLAYQDVWNLFDQMIISQALLNSKFKTYTFTKYKIFNKSFVIEDYGNFKGYPFRTYAGGTYRGGYSDHFAVYCFLMKEK
jgi:Endonuclease/Exonuclease/phosphatase family